MQAAARARLGAAASPRVRVVTPPVAHGPFVALGGIVEASPELAEARAHPDYLALLTVVDGEPPLLQVLPDVTQERLDALEVWAARRCERLRDLGEDADGWTTGPWDGERWAAQVWARPIHLPDL